MVKKRKKWIERRITRVEADGGLDLESGKSYILRTATPAFEVGFRLGLDDCHAALVLGAQAGRLALVSNVGFLN